MSEADKLIRALKLKPHPEGGWFRETFRDSKSTRGRAHSTAIYFLLKDGELSRRHRIDATEIWHWYAGAPLKLGIGKSVSSPKYEILGGDLSKGQRPQIVVPARQWQCARSLGDYTLVGCTVAPGFLFEKFELASISLEKPNAKRGRSPAKTRGPRIRGRD
jgi:predicted cupin superfamily sugar epimerase